MTADILNFSPRDLPTDGGKARILRRRDNFKFRNIDAQASDNADDLMMDHADNGMPSDSAYYAPDTDPTSTHGYHPCS